MTKEELQALKEAVDKAVDEQKEAEAIEQFRDILISERCTKIKLQVEYLDGLMNEEPKKHVIAFNKKGSEEFISEIADILQDVLDAYYERLERFDTEALNG